jgi:hypothetical protein
MNFTVSIAETGQIIDIKIITDTKEDQQIVDRIVDQFIKWYSQNRGQSYAGIFPRCRRS